MNRLFFALVAVAVAVAAGRELAGITSNAMAALSAAILEAAAGSVTLALGLVGSMALFLGLMKVAEAAGLLLGLARLLAPLMVRLFPDVPMSHPAMGSMILNMSANILGLNNAATPFGLRAMEHLERLNPCKGVASNAQVLFLVINTASLSILPTSVIALRAASGSHNPAAVVAPALLATLVALVVAVPVTRLLQRLSPVSAPVPPDEVPENSAEAATLSEESSAPLVPAPLWACGLALALLLLSIPLLAVYGGVIGPWLIPLLLVGLLGWGILRGVRIYEVFVEGAREGFTIAVRIIPYLVAILVAVGMLRTSGSLDLILTPLGRLTEPLGLPIEALTMGLMRVVSGSGSFGLLASYLQDPAIGPDSFLGVLLGVVYGSSETTLYVLAVYFGAVGIKKMRHALAAGLIADAVGLLAAVLACRLLVP